MTLHDTGGTKFIMYIFQLYIKFHFLYHLDEPLLYRYEAPPVTRKGCLELLLKLLIFNQVV